MIVFYWVLASLGSISAGLCFLSDHPLQGSVMLVASGVWAVAAEVAADRRP